MPMSAFSLKYWCLVPLLCWFYSQLTTKKCTLVPWIKKIDIQMDRECVYTSLNHSHYIWRSILSAVPIHWSTLCVYLLQSWRHGAVWQLWRNPKPTPLQSRRISALPKYRSLLWKSHQLKIDRENETWKWLLLEICM